MEILVLKFEGPISNNKENKMFAPPLGRQVRAKIFKMFPSDCITL